MEDCSDLWGNQHARSSQSAEFCLLILQKESTTEMLKYSDACAQICGFLFFYLKMIENYIIIRLEYPEIVINSFWLTIILQEKCG